MLTLSLLINGIRVEGPTSTIREMLGLPPLTSSTPVHRKIATASAVTKTSKAPKRARRSKGAEPTLWLADKNARRVPNFVITQTGLDTKKKIVAKYGEDARFELGKPLPTARVHSAPATTANGTPRKRPAKSQQTAMAAS